MYTIPGLRKCLSLLRVVSACSFATLTSLGSPGQALFKALLPLLHSPQDPWPLPWGVAHYLQLFPGKLRRATGLWVAVKLMVNLEPPKKHTHPIIAQPGTLVFSWTLHPLLHVPSFPQPCGFFPKCYSRSHHFLPSHSTPFLLMSPFCLFPKQWQQDLFKMEIGLCNAHESCQTINSRWTLGPRAMKKIETLSEDNRQHKGRISSTRCQKDRKENMDRSDYLNTGHFCSLRVTKEEVARRPRT